MANRFWIGDGGTWTDTAHWSTTSGGGGGASVPGANDSAFFDANSFTVGAQIVTKTGNLAIGNLSFAGVTNAPTLRINGGGQLQIFGNYTGQASVIFNIANGIVFETGGGAATPTSFTIDPQGQDLGGPAGANLGVEITFSTSFLKTVTLLSDLTVTAGTGGFSIFSVSVTGSGGGVFNANGFDVQVEYFEPSGTAGVVPTITMGSGTWTLKPTTTFTSIWQDAAGSNAATINATNSTLLIDLSSAVIASHTFFTTVARTFNIMQIIGNGASARSVYFNGENITADSLTFSGAPIGMKLSAGKTYTFPSSLDMNGSLGNLITLISDGSAATLSTDSFSGSYIDVANNTAAGAAIPFDDTTGGVNSGGNTNWLFPTPPVASFTGTPQAGFVSLDVTFTDTSTGSPTAWAWTFGDGGTSTAQNPTHTYTSPGSYTVSLTASNGGGSSTVTHTHFIAASSSNLFLQTVFMVGADTSANVQTINTGKNDDGTPIFYELFTQEIEYGNRAHLKKIADEIAVFTQFGEDSNFSFLTDSKDETPIDMNLGERVNIGKSIDIEGHFVTYRWFGTSSDISPVFEGIYVEKITDMGMTKS